MRGGVTGAPYIGNNKIMMHIACASDEGYLPHCATMLLSLLEHNCSKEVTVHFMHGPLMSSQLLDKLISMIRGCGASINCLEIDDDAVAGLQTRAGVAGVMWYRVFLPELLPKHDRIVYLDVDLLVMDSLQEIWEMELGNAYAAAVPNVFEPERANHAINLGMKRQSDYFNSGLLVLNLAALRRYQLSKKILAIARESGDELEWQDQDPLNIAFDGNWKRLHPRWNCQNSLYFYDYADAQFGKKVVRESIDHPAIVHFEGPAYKKPWHRLCKHPHQSTYLYYRQKTPWSDVVLMGDTLKNRLLRILPHKLLMYGVGLRMRMLNWFRTRNKSQSVQNGY